MSENPVAVRIANTTETTSRRDAIKVGLAALAGVGLTALAPKEAFAAANGNFILGQANDSGSAATSISSSAASAFTLAVNNTNSTNGSALYAAQSGGSGHAALLNHSGSGTGLEVQQTGSGIPIVAWTVSTANDNPAIWATATGSNATGVLGESNSVYPNARGLKGWLTDAAAEGCAIEGNTSGSGGATGVWGNVAPGGTGYAVKASNSGVGGALKAEISNAASSALAASVTTAGTGEGLKAQISNAANSSAALTGQTDGTGYAIYGYTSKSNSEKATVMGNSVSTHANARGIWGNLAAGGTNGYGVEGRTIGHGGGVLAQAVTPSDGVGLFAYTSGTGSAIKAEVNNTANTATAVTVTHSGTGAGLSVDTANAGTAQATIQGNSQSTHADARGVKGSLVSASSAGYGVEGRTSSSMGGGVLARAEAPGSALALHAVSTGGGTAARVQVTNASNGQPALIAVTNGTGCAIQAEGGRAQLYLKPAAAAGAPTSGSHLLGDIFMDSAGALHTCTSSGTPGTWIRLAAASSSIQTSLTDSTNDFILNVAQTGSGYAIQAQGGKAQLFLKPAAATGAPKSGAHLRGEIFVDAPGVMYACTGSGTPGTWGAVVRGGTNTAAVTVKSPSPASPAIKAQASAANGAALRVEGTMSMTRSGKAKISKRKQSVTVTVPGGVSTGALIMSTLQGSGGSGVYIKYAKRASSTQIKIVLSKAATSTVYVGWMVLG